MSEIHCLQENNLEKLELGCTLLFYQFTCNFLNVLIYLKYNKLRTLLILSVLHMSHIPCHDFFSFLQLTNLIGTYPYTIPYQARSLL